MTDLPPKEAIEEPADGVRAAPEVRERDLLRELREQGGMQAARAEPEDEKASSGKPPKK